MTWKKETSPVPAPQLRRRRTRRRRRGRPERLSRPLDLSPPSSSFWWSSLASLSTFAGINMEETECSDSAPSIKSRYITPKRFHFPHFLGEEMMIPIDQMRTWCCRRGVERLVDTLRCLSIPARKRSVTEKRIAFAVDSWVVRYSLDMRKTMEISSFSSSSGHLLYK